MIFVETLDGNKYDLEKIGMRAKSFIIDSLVPINNYEVIEGKNGRVDMGATLDGRNITATFRLFGKDKYDSLLLLSEVFKLFDARTEFYLIDSRQPRKRWRVRTASSFSPEILNHLMQDIEVQFFSPSPYCESTSTTLRPRTFEEEAWQVGQGLISENLSYVHNTTTFRIWNGSDTEIDPREIPLLIKYQGASDNLTITNNTNGDVWKYNKTSNANDTILIDGVRSLKNSFTIFRDTNRKLITLEKGWNDFVLSGAVDNFLISFDFRFYNI